MAVRIAEGEGDKKDPKKQDLHEMDPRWDKVKTIIQTKLKPAIKDLEAAVTDEDEKLSQFMFERLLELATGLSKGFGMRDFTKKLKMLETQTFD